MPAIDQTPTLSDVRQTIVRHLIHYVDNPCVSIAEVIRAVKRTFPHCELTDWQIGNLVEQSATEAGIAIEFDAADPTRSLP